MSAAVVGAAPRIGGRTVEGLVLSAATVAGILVVWELTVRAGVVPGRFASPPTVIAVELTRLLGGAPLWRLVADTLVGWSASLALGTLLGTGVGVLLGRVRWLQTISSPLVEFLRPIPSIAMIPLVVLTMGSGKTSEIFLATYAAFWQVLVAAVMAVRSVDPVALDTARAFGLGRWAQLRHLLLPSMLPRLATGVRVASSTALIFCITAELLTGSPGLGSGLGAARGVGDLPQMYALVVVIGCLGLVLAALLAAVERRLLTWHPSQRKDAR